jgi:hypothetical protein
MSLVDLEKNNEEEINAIKQLDREISKGFCLNGEPLSSTHLITYKINISSDRTIEAK